MADKPQTEEAGQETSVDSDGTGERAKIILLEALYNTKRERLPEMSNIPLDKVRPLTWILVYAKEILEICEEIIESQQRMSKRYAEYHGGVEPKVDWVDNWLGVKGKPGAKDKVGIKDTILLLMVEWVYTYCQFRRSVLGEHVKNAVLLSQDQIAAEQDKEEGSPWDSAKNQ